MMGPLPARAKVNLYLHVTGRRADGYHELDSLFVRTALADRLTLVAADTDSLAVTGPFAAALVDEPPERNLALRAIAAVRERCGGGPGVAVTLEKTIPVAAGLGGGSADAAAALRAANVLFGAGLDEAALVELAASLGADVPACLHEGPLWVSGIGERIVPLPLLPSFALVLVNPGAALSTASVFRAFVGAYGEAMPMTAPADLEGLVAALAARRNDLEEAARSLVPEVGEALDLLAAQPGVRLARMSGSGATCFGLVGDLSAAGAVADALRRARPGWWVAPTAVGGTR